MTFRKTEWLPDGSIIEYESNPGAEPKITLNGQPITLDHYQEISGTKKQSLVQFIKGLFK